jgi:hypothetical protein
MKVLVAAGLVVQDGYMKTGKQGKPPAAWVPVEGWESKEIPVIEEKVPTPRGVPQATIDRVIAEVTASSYGGSCSCVVAAGPGTTAEEIRAFGAGCTDPNWVCGALDAVRRRANLFAPEERFVEVTDKNREQRLAEFKERERMETAGA